MFVLAITIIKILTEYYPEDIRFSIEIDPEKTIAGVESGVTLSRVAIRPLVWLFKSN